MISMSIRQHVLFGVFCIVQVASTLCEHSSVNRLPLSKSMIEQHRAQFHEQFKRQILIQKLLVSKKFKLAGQVASAGILMGCMYGLFKAGGFGFLTTKEIEYIKRMCADSGDVATSHTAGFWHALTHQYLPLVGAQMVFSGATEALGALARPDTTLGKFFSLHTPQWYISTHTQLAKTVSDLKWAAAKLDPQSPILNTGRNVVITVPSDITHTRRLFGQSMKNIDELVRLNTYAIVKNSGKETENADILKERIDRIYALLNMFVIDIGALIAFVEYQADRANQTRVQGALSEDAQTIFDSAMILLDRYETVLHEYADWADICAQQKEMMSAVVENNGLLALAFETQYFFDRLMSA